MVSSSSSRTRLPRFAPVGASLDRFLGQLAAHPDQPTWVVLGEDHGCHRWVSEERPQILDLFERLKGHLWGERLPRGQVETFGYAPHRSLLLWGLEDPVLQEAAGLLYPLLDLSDPGPWVTRLQRVLLNGDTTNLGWVWRVYVGPLQGSLPCPDLCRALAPWATPGGARELGEAALARALLWARGPAAPPVLKALKIPPDLGASLPQGPFAQGLRGTLSRLARARERAMAHTLAHALGPGGPPPLLAGALVGLAHCAPLLTRLAELVPRPRLLLHRGLSGQKSAPWQTPLKI